MMQAHRVEPEPRIDARMVVEAIGSAIVAFILIVIFLTFGGQP